MNTNEDLQLAIEKAMDMLVDFAEKYQLGIHGTIAFTLPSGRPQKAVHIEQLYFDPEEEDENEEEGDMTPF